MAPSREQAQQIWEDAQTLVDDYKLELQHAQSMKNEPRIAHCKRWLVEAQQQKRAAYRRLRSTPPDPRPKVQEQWTQT